MAIIVRASGIIGLILPVATYRLVVWLEQL